MNNFRVRAMFVVVFTGLIAALSGCGGSNNGLTAHPSTALISETTNNSFSYNITGSAAPTAGGATQTVTGTGTVTITNPGFNLNPAVQAIVLTSNVSLNGGPLEQFIVTYYFEQDVNNNIIEYGQSITDTAGTVTTTKTIITPSLANSEIFPGTFTEGTTVTTTLQFTDSTSADWVAAVVAPTSVTTPDGTFAVWQVEVTQNGNAVGTEYWDPALGMFVAGNINNANITLGATPYNLNLSYTLTGTNVVAAP